MEVLLDSCHWSKDGYSDHNRSKALLLHKTIDKSTKLHAKTAASRIESVKLFITQDQKETHTLDKLAKQSRTKNSFRSYIEKNWNAQQPEEIQMR